MVFWWARYENVTVGQKREFNPQFETENPKRNATLKTCEILPLLSYTWYRLNFRLPALSACRRSCRMSTALQDACFPDSSLSSPLVVAILAVISCCQGRRYGEGRLMLKFWAAKYIISIKENYALAAYKLLSHFEGKSINNCDFFSKGLLFQLLVQGTKTF
jgi:hypothetical protein